MPHFLEALAQTHNLDLVGAVPVGPAPTMDAYRAWLAQGYAGDMGYLARADAVTKRADPRAILPETLTVLVVAASYAGAPHPPCPPLHGRVSRYAWGEDYHRWLLRRLKALVRELAAERGFAAEVGPFPYKAYVDTGPVLERAWAQAAGLGWIGKNTCLLHPVLGSFTFLGVALLGIDLSPTPAPALPTCGTCTRCLDACPTGALVAPGELDARRCLAYLTIEHRGPIPEPLRPLLGDTVFGCDICQDVCPWNRRPLAAHSDEVAPPEATLALTELLTLDAAAFRARYRRSPIWRATPEGLARNAAIVLGNQAHPAARPALEIAARAHPSPLVREHAQWALGKV